MQLYCTVGTVHRSSRDISSTPRPPPRVSCEVCVLLWLFMVWLRLSLFCHSVSYSKYWMHVREVKLPSILTTETNSGTWWRIWGSCVSVFLLQMLLILWINNRVHIFVLVFYVHVSTMVINRLFQSISGFIAFTIMFFTKLNTKSIISIKCRILKNYWH